MRTRVAFAGCLGLVLSVAALGSGTAIAHQSPPGCNTDSLNPLPPTVNLTMHRNGEVVDFDPGFRNPNVNACDVTGFNVSITFPKPDGTAGGAGETVVVAENQSAPGSSGDVRFSVPHTIDFNDGVYSGPVTVTLSSGIWHGPTDGPEGGGSSGSTLYISRPHVTLAVTPSLTDLDGPGPVTYTYMVHNGSTTFPGDTGFLSMVESVMTDDSCAPVTYVSGDAGSSTWLDAGETWTYTCTTTISRIGTTTNHASYSGNYLRDSVPGPITATADASVFVHGSDLRAAISHHGLFVRGKTGSYSVVARNTGDEAPTAQGDPAPVTADVKLPTGLTATKLSGPGWTCSTAELTCSRADVLAGGDSFPPITVETDVAANAPGNVIATASVSSPGDDDNTNNEASDPTTIVSADPEPGPGPGPGSEKVNFTRLILQPKKKKVKAGKKIKLKLEVTNSGEKKGTATVRLTSSSKKKAKVQKSVKVTVGAGKTVTKVFKVTTKRKKKGKVTIKARLGKRTARTVLQLKK